MHCNTSSRSADKAEIAEFGHLVLHDGRVVAQLAAVVLVVAGPDDDDRSVGDLAQGHDAEGDGQRFVGAPVRRQGRAEEVRAARLDELALVVDHRVECRRRRRRRRVLRAFRHQNFS